MCLFGDGKKVKEAGKGKEGRNPTYRAAGDLAGHMCTGDVVDLGGIVRGVGAYTFLALGGVHWRSRL